MSLTLQGSTPNCQLQGPFAYWAGGLTPPQGPVGGVQDRPSHILRERGRDAHVTIASPERGMAAIVVPLEPLAALLPPHHVLLQL